MNYKQMVLLEHLVEQLPPEKNYKLYFTYNLKSTCTGRFKKTTGKLAREGRVSIHSKKLLHDFKYYLNDYIETKQPLMDLVTDIYDDVYNEVEFSQFLLDDMENFLEDEETDVDSYLTGYDGLEMIYDFSTEEGYYGDLDMYGLDLIVLSLYDLGMFL